MARSNRAATAAPEPDPKKTGRAGRAAPQPDSGVKDIRAALAALNEQGWSDTEEKKFGEVPDDRYQIKIDEATINNSKSSGRLQVSWQATIVGGGTPPGSYNNMKLFWHDGIDNSDQRSWFRGRLARLGIEWPASAEELPDTLEQAKGSFAEVNVKTKDEFQNVNVLKAIDSGDVEEAQTEEAETEAETETPAEPETAAQNEVSFKDGNLTPQMKARIVKMATMAGLDPTSYAKNSDKHCDMLLDMADQIPLDAQMWEDPKELIDAIFEKL